ncbi:MAG: hypothetical protein PVJ53_18120 [Desulfobacterales bacterium]|jgi:hypothetical protein
MKNYSWNFWIDRHRPAVRWTDSLPRGICRWIWLGLILAACAQPPPDQPRGHAIGPIASYVFQPDPQEYLTAPQPFALAPEMSPAEALAALGEHLSQNYFNDAAENVAPPIRLEILAVHYLAVPHRTYRLAVINMIDPQEEALQGYFQGSSGGQTTFYMLAATLLQPQLEPPLADGLILLYNNEAFPTIDHVNFRGIVTTEMVGAIVRKVLLQNRVTTSAVTG